MPCTLPIEVIEIIVSFLQCDDDDSDNPAKILENRATLCNCALTCRQLLSVSRRTLMFSVAVTSSASISSLIRHNRSTASSIGRPATFVDSIHTLHVYDAAINTFPHQLFLKHHSSSDYASIISTGLESQCTTLSLLSYRNSDPSAGSSLSIASFEHFAKFGVSYPHYLAWRTWEWKADVRGRNCRKRPYHNGWIRSHPA